MPITSFGRATPGFQHYSLHLQPGGMDQGSAATAETSDPVDVEHFLATNEGGLEPTEDSHHLKSAPYTPYSIFLRGTISLLLSVLYILSGFRVVGSALILGLGSKG